MKAIPFTWSDAWLLLAIWHADGGEGAVLRDVIAVGDYLNHAIFSYGEVKNGLSRLTMGGYVLEEEGRFRLIGDAWESMAPDIGRRQSVFKQRERLEKFLGLARIDPGGKPECDNPAWPYPSVSLEGFKVACQEYRGQWTSSEKRAKKR